jgi:diguanylate cyclase (GGDEF)-like protein
MSDSEILPPNPESDGAPDVGGPGNGAPSASSASAPQSVGPSEPASSSTSSALEPSAGASLPTPPGSGGERFAHMKRIALGRTGVWAAVAVLCVAGGAVGSVIGAHAVASTDATEARQAFPRTAGGIASTLKLALQHEEDLLISGSTFFAGRPTASAAEFDTWVKWAQALRRYPELENLGLVALAPAPEPSAPQARTLGGAVKPLGSSSLKTPSSSPAAGRAHAIPGGTRSSLPPGTRPNHCYVAVELSRSLGRTQSSSDYCAHTPGLLASRDAGVSVYTAAAAPRGKGLGIETPVYRGNVPPSSRAGRRGAFVGWLREVLIPEVMLQRVLQGHSEYAVRLSHKAGSSKISFTSGSASRGGQSSAISLHNGWIVKTAGPASPAADVLKDNNALALLIVGCVLSVLLGLLVFILGGGRAPAPAQGVLRLPHNDLYDPLTRLPNRALMLDRAERMLARAGRQSGLLVGALFIDIDWFKDVNDKLGEGAGDQLLTIVAERLEGVVRTHDTVGRLGGDEFVVLVESAARGARLDALARRVIEALHKRVELEGFGPSFALTASIGVAFGRYASPDDLLRDAQLALHAAQAAGRDRYTLFNANMRSVIEGRGVLEAELNAALAQKQFFLLYQPIFDLGTRKAVDLEALIRWQHPTQGALPPEDFLPLAEESGLIVPIGRWALEEACSRTAAWNVTGRRVGVSVQVSPTQLNRDGFITDVRRALQQSGLSPSLLTLEVPEGTVMRDVKAARERLEEVKQLGVRIAIDDFGSGYAQHTDLQQMPLDFLRVNRSSLAASEDEDYRSWLLQTILIVGRDLSLPVIATEIETHEELSALQAMGCPMAQGSFMGKPTPANAVESVLDAELPASPATSPSPPASPSPATSASPTAPHPPRPLRLP